MPGPASPWLQLLDGPPVSAWLRAGRWEGKNRWEMVSWLAEDENNYSHCPFSVFAVIMLWGRRTWLKRRERVVCSAFHSSSFFLLTTSKWSLEGKELKERRRKDTNGGIESETWQCEKPKKYQRQTRRKVKDRQEIKDAESNFPLVLSHLTKVIWSAFFWVFSCCGLTKFLL